MTRKAARHRGLTAGRGCCRLKVRSPMSSLPPSTATARAAAGHDPIRSYTGTPERASLQARLAAMAAESIETRSWVGREHRHGSAAKVVMPHDHQYEPRNLLPGVTGTGCTTPSTPRSPRGGSGPRGRFGDRSRRCFSSGGAPRHDLARHHQRRDNAWAVEDGVSGGNRRGVRERRLPSASMRTSDRSSSPMQPLSDQTA